MTPKQKRSGRLVVEIPFEMTDADWTLETLLENVPTYLSILVHDGEKENARSFGEKQTYRLSDDVTVWVSPEEYVTCMAQVWGKRRNK